MKIIYRICLFFLPFFIFSCENENSYILKGEIKGLENKEIFVVSGADLQIDTINTKSGKFTYRGVSPTVEPLLIYMENGSAWITLWVQNGEKYTLKGEANYPELMMVKGGEINKLFSDFKNDNLSYIKEKCELRDKLSARLEILPDSSVNYSSLSLQMKNIDNILKTKAQDFVETNTSSIAALIMIQDYILDFESASDIQPFLDILSEEVKSNPLFEKLQLLSKKDLQTKNGQPALDFSIIDIKNDSVNLGKFKDKYLILNFANSYSEFCKPEFAGLLSIKDSFPEKELAILTISLDENKADWKNTANENGINWIQAIDSTGWASEMVSLYNVMSVPCNFLIDKNGVIIGSRISVDSIQSMLRERVKLKTKN